MPATTLWERSQTISIRVAADGGVSRFQPNTIMFSLNLSGSHLSSRESLNSFKMSPHANVWGGNVLWEGILHHFTIMRGPTKGREHQHTSLTRDLKRLIRLVQFPHGGTSATLYPAWTTLMCNWSLQLHQSGSHWPALELTTSSYRQNVLWSINSPFKSLPVWHPLLGTPVHKRQALQTSPHYLVNGCAL